MRRCCITVVIGLAIFIGIRASAPVAANRAAETGSTPGRPTRLGESAYGQQKPAAVRQNGAQNTNTPKETGQGATKQNQPASDADQSSFLIARRELDDPLFGKAVVLMFPVVDKGVVVGLIVNRPTRIALHKLFPKIAAYKDGTAVAYFGGPVDVKTAGVLFRSTKAYKQAFHLTGDLYTSFNADLIEKVLKKPKEVEDVRLFLGRSQWTPEQLAGEIERGSWFGEKEVNSVIFRRDSASVWLELIGPLEPGSMAEWEKPGAGNASFACNVFARRQQACAAPGGALFLFASRPSPSALGRSCRAGGAAVFWASIALSTSKNRNMSG